MGTYRRTDDLERFYGILSDLEWRLGGVRRLDQCRGRDPWPPRGVYFFMEDGETRHESGVGSRIVRVGTHALKPGSRTSLWTRLSQHQGSQKSGGGNHRGSIFRLIVGAALAARDCMDATTWGGEKSAEVGLRASELCLEQAVSRHIRAMPFLWLPVDDEPGPQSLRGDIERNAIALLSNFAAPASDRLDPCSPGWLGMFCDRERVRRSGLWNSNHVDEAYDPAFLDRFEHLVDRVEVGR